jgi:predicted enzyme related to lactoylglutathione lyase
MQASMKISPLGIKSVKVIALAATDGLRARRFYSETLQLEEDRESTDEVGYRIGDVVLVIRSHTPTADPNPRITLQVEDARETEKRLAERGVTISDPVNLYESRFWVGAFLDSEGNKLWFCSYAWAGAKNNERVDILLTSIVSLLAAIDRVIQERTPN